MDVYDYSPLGKAEQLYNAAEREERITNKLKEEVANACRHRKLSRSTVASDLGFGTSTFNHIVRGQYSARTDDHVKRILRYTGCTEQEIADALDHTPTISFRDMAANDEQLLDCEIEAVTEEDAAYVFSDDTLENCRATEPEQQASIDAMQSALQRQENHTVYAPIHLGSWLQLQKDLLEETPQAHLSAIAYSCVVRMSSFDRHKLKRIIDDLQERDDLHGC